uniref:DNA helicase n=1 Tax=Glossina palpalis gambiensis TaxID=67801 RepID=A0A1B0C095_9MUSC
MANMPNSVFSKLLRQHPEMWGVGGRTPCKLERKKFADRLTAITGQLYLKEVRKTAPCNIELEVVLMFCYLRNIIDRTGLEVDKECYVSFTKVPTRHKVQVVRTHAVHPKLVLDTFMCLDCQTEIRNVEQQFKFTNPSICLAEHAPLIGARVQLALSSHPLTLHYVHLVAALESSIAARCATTKLSWLEK